MRQFILIISLLLLHSCNQVAKIVTGFKDPKLETPTTINNYLKENNMQPGNNYICKDTVSYFRIIKVFDKHIPEAVLFDKNGNELIYKETSESCNAGLFRVIPDLKIESDLKKGTHNLQELLSNYTIPLDGKENQLYNDTDYYLLIDWAIFVAKRNNDHVTAWEDLAKNNKNVRIKVLKLNMDFQESWGLTEKDIKIK